MLGGAVLCALLGAALAFDYGLVVAASIAVVVFSVAFLLDPRVAVLVLLLGRASIDFIAYGTAVTGSAYASLNLLVLLALIVTVLGSTVLLRRGLSLAPVSLATWYYAFLGAGLISIALSAFPIVSLAEFSRHMSTLVLFLLVSQLFGDPKWRIRAVWAIALSSVVPMLVAAYQAATGTGQAGLGDIVQVYGTFSHPNDFGRHLVIAGLMTLPLAYSEQRTRFRRLAKLLLAIAVILLLLSYSRGAWIAAIVGVIVFGFRARPRLLVPLLLGLAAAYSTNLLGIQSRFAGVMMESTQVSSLFTRRLIWADAIQQALQSPFVGQGLGTFPFAAVSRFGQIRAHNEYLRFFFEVGALGLIAHVGIHLAAVREGWVRWTSQDAGFDGIVGASVAAAFCAMMVLALAENVYSGLSTQWYLFSAVGLVVASKRSVSSHKHGREDIVPSAVT